jgi:hypothetical protein
MKNSSLVSTRYCEQALLVASVICLLLFTGCSSIDGTTENQRVRTNLLTSHVGQWHYEPQIQAASPDPSYEWFY